MADFYSHRALSKIQSGTRVQPVSELHNLQSELGSLAPIGLKAIKPSLLIADRKTDYKAYIAKMELGQLAGSISITNDPVYTILPHGINGSKYPHPEEQVHFSNRDTGALVTKIYTGISTHGIGYVPENTDTNNKEIRRWPRNWYGDNIKS